MSLHKDLTGAELHEPKGADTASSGTVYEANGSGSGAWVPRLTGLFNANKYWLSGRIADISTPNSSTFFYVPAASEMFELAVILDAPITGTNDTINIYVNGVLFADTLTVATAGSTAGKLFRTNITTTNSVASGSVVEVRTNGASDGAVAATVVLGLRQTA